MGQFFILRSRCNKSTTVCLLTHWTVLLKAVCPWIISNGCLQKWTFRAFEILYPVLGNVSEMDTPFYIRSFKITTPLAAHTRIGNVWEYPPSRGTGFLFSLTSKEEHTRTRSWFLITPISSWLQLVWRHWFLLASLLHLFHSWFPE